eukprot:455070_1
MADDFKEVSVYTNTCDESQAFLNSEREYVENGLRVGFETFLNRLEVHNKLNQPIISDDDINIIFSNYRTLYNANSKLFDDLMLLRLDGITKLRDNLGKYMVDFIPYFRIYTDYIVKKQAAIVHLDKLKKSNKKFRQFVRINEVCTGRKLKAFLEEPAARLPQYLQHLAAVYVAFENETGSQSEAALNLLQAIVDIKKVTDEIAVKCRDLKARLLVGALQKDVFGNKIQLLAAHRYCISHASMHMVVHDKTDKIKTHKFILCNDILVVSTMASSFKSGQLIAVYPLIGLRIAREPRLSDALLDNTTDHNKLVHRFALVPQNKNFTPSTETGNTYVGSLIIICDTERQLEKWIQTIEDTVDEEEHNLKPCNPVDLELRLRKQKTSREGEAETITITDPEKIKEIEAWKVARASGNPLPRQRSSKKRKPPKKAKRTTSVGVNRAPAKPPSKPPSKPPPRRGTLNAHRRQRSGPLPPGKHATDAKAPPNAPPKPSRSAPGTPDAPPPKKAPSQFPKTLPHKPPKRKGQSPMSRRNKSPPPKTPPPHPTIKESVETKQILKPHNVVKNKQNIKEKKSKHVPLKKTDSGKRAPLKKQDSRNKMLAGIQGFQKTKSLKHVDHDTLKKEARANPSNVTNLLQSTLKNYRQFVMDDDDSDDS